MKENVSGCFFSENSLHGEKFARQQVTSKHFNCCSQGTISACVPKSLAPKIDSIMSSLQLTTT